MSIYDANAHCWSGLGSGPISDWQEPLRDICSDIGGVQFHPTNSGYGGWQEVAEAAASRNEKALLLIGHSNGVYAITKIAEWLKENSNVECWICSFDETLKSCPKIGSNVPHAVDIWAGLDKLERGSDFNGDLAFYNFQSESHIGIISNPDAQKIAINFGKKFKSKYGS